MTEITKEKVQTKNFFKFGIYFQNRIIAERIFDADCYNQMTRNSVNIVEWSNQIKFDIQDVLSSRTKELSTELKSYDVTYDYDLSSQLNIEDFLNKKNLDAIHFNEYDHLNNSKSPIKGFKYKLSKNQVEEGKDVVENIIIEREFSVANFNSKSIFSSDLIEVLNDWSDRIEQKIKKQDETQMWDEFDIMNHNQNLSLTQIRSLSREEKNKLLYRIHRN